MQVIGDKPELKLNSVIYATDFSLCAENAGAYALRIADYFAASLLIVHAFTLSQAAMEVEVAKLLESAQRKDLQILLLKKASLLTTQRAHALPMLLEGDPKEVIPLLADVHSPSLVELGKSFHSSGSCFFILWKVLAFAFAFVLALRQAATFCMAVDSALIPMAQIKPSSSRPTAVMILRWSLPAAANRA